VNAVRLTRSEKGMTLIELLIAMTILAIGIAALVAGFSSGLLAVQRGAKTSVAGTLADQAIEIYRQGTFSSIPIGVQTPPPAPGSDGHTYDVVTTVQWTCAIGPPMTGSTPPTCTGASLSRPVKLVTVDVHDSSATGRILASQSTTFDSSTS
jgi:prepilin-type N-terminal cleavage/methylation domain-containing protein